MSPKSKTNLDTEYTLWQLPGSVDPASMAFVVRSSGGFCFVIDGGSSEDAEGLESFIIENCASKVDAWFITHPHSKSAGALIKLLKSRNRKIAIEKIVYSHVIPAEAEEYESASAAFVEDFNLTVKSSACQKINVHTGERIKIDRALVRVFSSPDADIKDDFINNAGVVYKFNLCCSSFLVLGDIGREAGIVLLENYKNELSCDLLQVPNHGKSHIPEDIYRLASPETCLWCTTADEWKNSSEVEKTRQALLNIGASEHRVSGINGLNEIRITY